MFKLCTCATRCRSSLYEFWGDKIATVLLGQLAKLPAGQRFFVNVASGEYFKAVLPYLSAQCRLLFCKCRLMKRARKS